MEVFFVGYAFVVSAPGFKNGIIRSWLYKSKPCLKLKIMINGMQKVFIGILELLWLISLFI